MTPRAQNRKARPRALVTGGAVRLGRAIALGLADAGFDVAIGYYHSRAAARVTVGELRRRGARAVAVRADLRRAEAAPRLVAAAARRLGGLDALVNNAALFYRTPLGGSAATRWDALLDVNLRAPFLCSQAAAACLGAHGHIVNVGDAATRAPWAGWSAYLAAKAGLEALTRTLAAELQPRGIAVNCVAPGPVLKPERLPAARWRVITRGRAVRPADVVRAVVRLARCPSTVTGRVVTVTRARRRR